MASINGKSVEGPATTATAGDGSLKTSFMRRFSRLSAKTRSKYRNELRRSTSLLELDSKAKSDEQLTEVDPTTTTRDKALTNWLGNRLRNKKLEENGKKQDAVIVGDTLLKQKPRLRVRNIGKSNTLGGGIKPADYTSSPMPDHHIITRQSRSATVGGGGQRSHSYNSESTTTATTSQSEMSEMEQVLFRAARLRQRQRGRSASIETRGTDRTSQLDKYSLNTEKISDGYDSDSHDDSSFMMYGSCAKTYNAKNEEPEVVSLSTEYDPNSTSSEFANDGSSGYASYSSSPIDKVEKEKEKLDSLPNLIVPEPTMATVARVDSNTHASAAAATTTANDAGGESPPSLFYVALVGQDKRQTQNYRVRSGYTGPREEIKLKKTQSMSEMREEPPVRRSTPPWLQRNNFQRGSLPLNYPKQNEMLSGDQLSTSTRRASCNSRDGFIIKPENVKVTESGGSKDEWKITIKISREKDDPSASSESYSRSSTSEAESCTSQPGRHTIVREARLRKKSSRSGSLPPQPTPPPVQLRQQQQLPTPKSDQNTQTSPVSTPRAATPATETPTMTTPCPTIKTQPPGTHQRDLVNKFKSVDVLPDMPRRSYLNNVVQQPLNRRKQKEEPKNFASILSKWENRCHLSRAASVEVLNSQSEQFRSRTNSTSTTTSSTTTSCLTANPVRPVNAEPSAHRATIEPRPHFQVTNVLTKTASPSVPSDGENKVRLPPLDSGPIFSRNRNRFGSSLTRYNSDTTMSQNNRNYDQVGDMGRYQYRQGPIGWKNPIQGL